MFVSTDKSGGSPSPTQSVVPFSHLNITGYRRRFRSEKTRALYHVRKTHVESLVIEPLVPHSSIFGH